MFQKAHEEWGSATYYSCREYFSLEPVGLLRRTVAAPHHSGSVSEKPRKPLGAEVADQGQWPENGRLPSVSFGWGGTEGSCDGSSQ